MRFYLLSLLLFCGFFLSTKAQTQRGIASVRALAHEGTVTKTGEFFSHDSLVASHRSIPLGSIVQVTNLKNQSSVNVRINDRGPFIKGHIIDLSEVAGQKIGIYNNQKAEVVLNILKIEKEQKLENFQNFQSEDGDYSIKLGSFGDKTNAEEFALGIAKKHNLDNISVIAEKYNGNPIYKVFLGKFQSRTIAEKYLAQLPKELQSGYVTTFEKSKQ